MKKPETLKEAFEILGLHPETDLEYLIKEIVKWGGFRIKHSYCTAESLMISALCQVFIFEEAHRRGIITYDWVPRR